MTKNVIKCGILAALVLSGTSLRSARQDTVRPPRVSVVQDWTHRHVVFTNNARPEVWAATARDPRLLHKWVQRSGYLLRAPIERSGPQRNPKPGPGPQSAAVDWNVSLAGGVLAQGMSPAKYTFDVNATASCANDFVVYGLDVAGSATQANMIAFNQLYAKGSAPAGGLCNRVNPAVMFAYNTTTAAGGKISTSPVLSLDGTKIAFVESTASSAIFHVLTWKTGAGNGTSATSAATPGSGNTATMTTLTYSATSGNTRSSPWVDYDNDTAYVGANDGKLYKITGVFNGTPTLAGAPWPVTVSSGVVIGGPVFDSVSGRIFVGDNNGVLKYVTASTGALGGTTLTVGSTGSNGAIYDSPLVDSSNGTVFAFSSNDGSSTSTAAVVVQANTSLTQLRRVAVGHGSFGEVANSKFMYNGTFSNGYYTTPSTGFLYLCGTEAANTKPALYRIGFTGTTLNATVNGGPVLMGQTGSTGEACSPMTEFYNPNVDLNGSVAGSQNDGLFVGLTGSCISGAGCIQAWDISGAMPTGPISQVSQVGGTSAIVVDNVSTGSEASSIYFSNRSTSSLTTRAVKLTQSGLQ